VLGDTPVVSELFLGDTFTCWGASTGSSDTNNAGTGEASLAKRIRSLRARLRRVDGFTETDITALHLLRCEFGVSVDANCNSQFQNHLISVQKPVKKNCDYQLNYFHKSILFNIMLHFKYDVITLKLLIKCQINIKISLLKVGVELC